MTEGEFVKEYSGSPISEEDLAHLICIKLTEGAVYSAARAYIDAGHLFLTALDNINYEFG